jgi:hypothetical protein
MNNTLKIIISFIVSTIIIISITIFSISYIVSSKVEEIKLHTQSQIIKAISEQNELYEKQIAEIVTKSNDKAIRMFEKSLQSAETTYQVYTSEYIQLMTEKAAIAQSKLQNNPSMAKSKELYDDLMATMETNNYDFGVGHNVIKPVDSDNIIDKYELLRQRLNDKGLSEAEIDKFLIEKFGENK